MKCPKCNNENLTLIRDWHIEPANEEIDRIYKCNNCGLEFKDVYIRLFYLDNKTDEIINEFD